MSFTLRSRSPEPQDLLVDVAVHFVKARGDAAAKVFKVKRIVASAARKRRSFERASRWPCTRRGCRGPAPMPWTSS